ncbi:MAG: hypothetical protein GY941_03660 [Planctomycetes bacterium]|nr:hypothetical protein [Planctomycetota bacterium]
MAIATFNVKSKTHIWAAFKGVAASAIIALPQFREALSTEHYFMILALFTSVDIVLRNVTTQAITEK